MLLLENNADDYKKLIKLKRKLIRIEATPKYTKDPNINEKFKGWLSSVSRGDVREYL